MTDDPLDRLFERMRSETAPAELEARILAAVTDHASAARYRLEDLGETARRGLVPGLVVLAASIALAVTVSLTSVNGAEPAPTIAPPWRDVLVLDAPDPAKALWPLGQS